MTGNRRRAGRGTLFIIALLFAASAALRFGSGVGKALAATPDIEAAGLAALDSTVCADQPVALAQALAARDAEVRTRELALETRLAALSLANQAIDERMAALTEAESKLSETLARSDGAAEADLARLTEVYETMKPKDAAALFEKMAPDFAAGFLGRMRPEAAAAVLSGMSAETAYGISVLVAGRNALVPKD